MDDLNETNPGLTLFSAELPWCCFCVEIKVLGMEQNFARTFYIINKNSWSQHLPERGTKVGTTHQGTPPLLARPGGLYPPSGPADDPPDTINSHFRRKNQRERIIAFHETKPAPPPVLHREARSGICLVLWRGGSSIFVITNPSP